MIQRSKRAGGRRAAAAGVSITVETPGPPVDGGAVDDGGRDGKFVRKGGGEGPRFVSFRNLEDQAAAGLVSVSLKHSG